MVVINTALVRFMLGYVVSSGILISVSSHSVYPDVTGVVFEDSWSQNRVRLWERSSKKFGNYYSHRWRHRHDVVLPYKAAISKKVDVFTCLKVSTDYELHSTILLLHRLRILVSSVFNVLWSYQGKLYFWGWKLEIYLGGNDVLLLL